MKETSHHRRLARFAATQDQRSIKEVIARAKAFAADEVWLSPVELKATIGRLAEALEARLDAPAPVEPVPQDDAPAALQASETEAPKATHRGTVLGLKGREDYVGELVSVEGGEFWQDQHGRRFSVVDYGYDAEEAYRLDLVTVEPAS